MTKAHGLTFLGIFAVFTLLTCWIASVGIDRGAEHNLRVVQTTLGTITGPLTGAIARGFQVCCLRFSLRLMLYCAPILLIGIGIQFIRAPGHRWVRAVQLICWVLGWLVWFGGGILSYAHALE